MVRFLVLLVTSLAGPVRARADAPPRLAISFAEAIGDSAQLPELVGASAAAAAISRVVVPRPWGPLWITAAPSLRVAPGEQRGFEGGVVVQQTLPLADLAGARRDHRDALAARRAAETAALALDARLAAASAWIDGWAARTRLELAVRDLVLAQAIEEVTARGLAAGAVIAPELADARAFVAEVRVRRIDAEGTVADAGYALAEATGRPGAVESAGPLPEPTLPPAEAWPQLVARARRLPAVAARRLAAQADRLRAVEEQRSRGTQLALGAELLRDGPGAAAVIATVAIGLPHDRGEREAGLALADARDADAQSDGLAQRASVDLARALHDVGHTAEVLAELEHGLVPAADDAAARRERAFALGESTLVELLAAQRTALAAHARVAEARARHAWARVRAWLLLQATEVAR